MKWDSTNVARASVEVAISPSRKAEEKIISDLRNKGVKCVAVDVGGNIIESIPKIIERALVASKRSGVINDCHVHDGAVAGAAKEAIMQISSKANGLNVGGKIGIARYGEHISICIFMNIGLLHLNEVVIGLAHRSIPIVE
jgi:hypothetical protein